MDSLEPLITIALAMGGAALTAGTLVWKTSGRDTENKIKIGVLEAGQVKLEKDLKEAREKADFDLKAAGEKADRVAFSLAEKSERNLKEANYSLSSAAQEKAEKLVAIERDLHNLRATVESSETRHTIETNEIKVSISGLSVMVQKMAVDVATIVGSLRNSDKD